MFACTFDMCIKLLLTYLLTYLLVYNASDRDLVVEEAVAVFGRQVPAGGTESELEARLGHHRVTKNTRQVHHGREKKHGLCPPTGGLHVDTAALVEKKHGLCPATGGFARRHDCTGREETPPCHRPKVGGNQDTDCVGNGDG